MTPQYYRHRIPPSWRTGTSRCLERRQSALSPSGLDHRPNRAEPTNAARARVSAWLSRLMALTCGMALALVAGDSARAAGTPMPWDGPLDRIVDNLTGPFALTVGVLGLVVLAVRILFGEQFGQFARSIINVIIAVAMITGGAGLLTALIPNASGAAYTIETPGASASPATAARDS